MRLLLALLLGAHAIAHVPGFLISWHLIRSRPDLPYRTTIFGGAVDVGATGMRVIGVLWLFAGLGVLLAAIGLVRNADGAWAFAGAAAAFSTLMTIAGWPDSKAGAVLNGIIVAALIWVAVVNL